MATRFGVDVGGTFTDLVAYDESSGRVLVAKWPSTPDAPDQAVLAAATAPRQLEVLGDAEYFLHGTTVGINALLERKGAVVGLLTTAGFRDVLESRRGDREDMYNPIWKADSPLVPRRLRLTVDERIFATGEIDKPLDDDGVRRALATFREEGVDAIAIVFINSYVNSVHEQQAARILREEGFEGAISLSAEVSGEFREFERTSTVTLDAFVRPKVSSYLRRLEMNLKDSGFDGQCLITSSGGGAMPFTVAEERPFETIMSGPVAGAVGTGALCRDLGIRSAITADVGGTSFDTCLVLDGRPQLKFEGSVLGMPLQAPWVDVRSIGSGGGSIAHIDDGGLLRVGPQSAGASPGPICYSRGGTLPTVTDAAAVLGMLGPGLLASDLHLDIETAGAAIESLGAQIGLSRHETAMGIMRIAASAMADAIRSVTIEQGEDPRDAVLVSFGGAGPLFSSLLAAELDIRKSIVPRYAGNFSAWSLLGQDVTRTSARTFVEALTDDGLAEVDRLAGDLFEGLDAASDVIRELAVDLRYTGQEYALTIDLDTDAAGSVASDASAVLERFTEAYHRSFGHGLDEPVEIVAVRATTRRLLPDHDVPVLTADGARTHEPVQAYSARLGDFTEFAVLESDGLKVGDVKDGPTIVVEQTTTVYVDHGERLTVDPSGHLMIERHD